MSRAGLGQEVAVSAEQKRLPAVSRVTAASRPADYRDPFAPLSFHQGMQGDVTVIIDRDLQPQPLAKTTLESGRVGNNPKPGDAHLNANDVIIAAKATAHLFHKPRNDREGGVGRGCGGAPGRAVYFRDNPFFFVDQGDSGFCPAGVDGDNGLFHEFSPVKINLNFFPFFISLMAKSVTIALPTTFTRRSAGRLLVIIATSP